MKSIFGKKEKGSITLFVLIAILMFIILAINIYININNKNMAQAEEILKVKNEYYASYEQMDEQYNKITNQN